MARTVYNNGDRVWTTVTGETKISNNEKSVYVIRTHCSHSHLYYMCFGMQVVSGRETAITGTKNLGGLKR